MHFCEIILGLCASLKTVIDNSNLSSIAFLSKIPNKSEIQTLNSKSNRNRLCPLVMRAHILILISVSYFAENFGCVLIKLIGIRNEVGNNVGQLCPHAEDIEYN